MDFNITVLGSSAALPTATRQCSAQVVTIEGFRVLIDCGEGTQNQVRRYRIKFQAIDDIFISHLHGDHFYGLPGLLSSMHLCGRTTPLNIFAPKGIKRILTEIFSISGAHLGYELNFYELEGNGPQLLIDNKKCQITAFPLLHSVPAYGFLIKEKPQLLNLKHGVRDTYNLAHDDMIRIKSGEDYLTPDGKLIPNNLLTRPRKAPLSYAYCCDTLYAPSLLPYIKDVDLLCFDCTFEHSMLEIATEKLHGTTVTAATAARDANARRLMLTHFSARYGDVEPLVEEAKKVFPNTFAATDGLRIELNNI